MVKGVVIDVGDVGDVLVKCKVEMDESLKLSSVN